MSKRNDIVLGMLFGDEGKGATTAFLSKENNPNYVVKFSGGPQTAHNVVEGTLHHTFAQFGAGTFAGIPTLITRYAMVNPFALLKEAEQLYETLNINPFSMLEISKNSLLNTPLHEAANKLREIARGTNRHGSCGYGVGETRHYEILGYDAPRIGDIRTPHLLHDKLTAFKNYIEPQVGDLSEFSPAIDEIVANYVALFEDLNIQVVEDDHILESLNKGYNVWEGTQGVLLDEHYGFWPHTTWTNTTSEKALQLAKEAGLETPRVIGCVRSYMTRHGNGPFPSEFSTNTWVDTYKEPHNHTGTYQGAWRAGLLDLQLFEHAVKATGGVDVLSIGHVDYPYSKVVSHWGGLENNPLPLDYVENNYIHPWTQLMMTEGFKQSAVYKNIPNLESLVNVLKDRAGLHHSTPTIVSSGADTGLRTWF